MPILQASLLVSKNKVQFPVSYCRREFPAHPGIYRSKTNLLILVLSVYKETVLRYNLHIQNVPRTWRPCEFLFLNPEPQDPWRSASPTVPTPCLIPAWDPLLECGYCPSSVSYLILDVPLGHLGLISSLAQVPTCLLGKIPLAFFDLLCPPQ